MTILLLFVVFLVETVFDTRFHLDAIFWLAAISFDVGVYLFQNFQSQIQSVFGYCVRAIIALLGLSALVLLGFILVNLPGFFLEYVIPFIAVLFRGVVWVLAIGFGVWILCLLAKGKCVQAKAPLPTSTPAGAAASPQPNLSASRNISPTSLPRPSNASAFSAPQPPSPPSHVSRTRLAHSISQLHPSSCAGRVVQPTSQATLSPPHDSPPLSPGTASLRLEVFDPKGKARELEPHFAQGGEGRIHSLKIQQNALVKIYLHPSGLAERNKKLQALVKQRLHETRPELAWPRFLVTDANGNSCGFAMARMTGVPLSHLSCPQQFQNLLPDFKWNDFVSISIQMLETLEYLHQNGICAVDFNPANFLICPKHKRLLWIDCDNFQVTDNNCVYPSHVFHRHYTAPELLRTAEKQLRTQDQDTFAASLLIYRILLQGDHPFRKKGGANLEQNLEHRVCPLAPGQEHFMPEGPWQRLWLSYSASMRNIFLRMWVEGINQPEVRPSPSELIAGLLKA